MAADDGDADLAAMAEDAANAPPPAAANGATAADAADPDAAVAQARAHDGTLYVGNLQWWTTDAAVERIAAEYGRLREPVIMLEDRQSGKSKGVAVVRFAEPEAAARCKEGVGGREVDGRPAVVTWAERGGAHGGGYAPPDPGLLATGQVGVAGAAGVGAMAVGGGGGGGGAASSGGAGGMSGGGSMGMRPHVGGYQQQHGQSYGGPGRGAYGGGGGMGGGGGGGGYEGGGGGGRGYGGGAGYLPMQQQQQQQQQQQPYGGLGGGAGGPAGGYGGGYPQQPQPQQQQPMMPPPPPMGGAPPLQAQEQQQQQQAPPPPPPPPPPAGRPRRFGVGTGGAQG